MLISRLYKEVSEEVIQERNQPPPIEDYDTSYKEHFDYLKLPGCNGKTPNKNPEVRNCLFRKAT